MSLQEEDRKKINFGIAAHVDAGKTTLTERILLFSNKIHRTGEVHEGEAKTDWMKQERERGITIQSAATFFNWNHQGRDYEMNLIDTPGHIDFSIEVERSFRILDSAVLVLDSVAGVEPQTRTVWSQARKHGLPLMCFMNKLDKQGSSYEKSLESLRQNFGREMAFAPIVISEEGESRITHDLVRNLTYRWNSDGSFSEEELSKDRFEVYRKSLLDSLAQASEVFLEKLLNDQELTLEDYHEALRLGLKERKLVPVLCGTALRNVGVQNLLDYLAILAPTPSTTEDRDLKALVFKVQHLKNYGLIHYTKIYSGTLNKGSQAFNLSTGKKFKFNRVMKMHVVESKEIKSAEKGDIIVLTGIEAHTGDTLSSDSKAEPLFSIDRPEPVLSVSVLPKRNSPQEFEKLSQALRVLTLQDPSLSYHEREYKGLRELVLSGMGELHLSVSVELMREHFSLELEVGEPKIEYRTTLIVRKPISYTLRKQTGGSGLWAKIDVLFEPIEDTSRLEFINKVVGGKIPNEYIPAVEDGIRAQAAMGLGGYPSFSGISCILHDGEIHKVDSNKLAFEMAGREALKAASVGNCRILEPYNLVTVETNEDYFGKVNGDLVSKRGSIFEVDRKDAKVIISAKVPLKELTGYVDHLRSITSGNGNVSYEFSHYEPVPRHLEDIILEESSGRRS